MQALLTIVAPLFFIVGFGFLCARQGYLSSEARKAFGFYVFYCSMPCYLLLAMSKTPRDMIVRLDYVGAYGLSMAAIAIMAAWICRRFYRLDFGQSLIASMGACYTNSAFIGIPVIVLAFGQTAPIVIITMFQVTMASTLILIGMEIYLRHGVFSLKALSVAPRAMLANPIVLSSFLGISIALLQWQIPAPVARGLELLGQASIPTALFALGLSFGEKRLAMPVTQRKLVFTLTGLKNFVHPLLAFSIGLYGFHLPPALLAPLTIAAALPTAVNQFVFAQRYETFTLESSQIVLFSTLIAMPILSVLLTLFGAGAS